MKFLDQIRGLTQTIHLTKDPSELFREIIGYEEVKKAFNLFLSSQKNINVLLDGPPGCSKTLFLLAILKHCKDVFFVDGSNASGPGMFDELLTSKQNTKYLLIDEIDGLSKKDQKALLNLFETGMLVSVKVRKQARKEFKNLKVFATCNNTEKLSNALMSRFFRLSLREYSETEFIDIAKKLYLKKDQELIEYIAKAVWHVLGSKDIRDFQKIADHSDNSTDADMLIELQLKYSKKRE